ncbi:hypothetical protein FRC00_001128 [Tulasnella sp. 408]|nr:hypothetical protein FRC00_001128 [Tulasnella sp. 408]
MDDGTLTNEPLIASPLRSALPPLQQPASIPVEILIEIFLLSLPPLDLAQAPQKTTLALVCRFWNAVVDSTPILWSGISITDPISYVRKSLLKSNQHPLEVNGTRLAPETDSGVACDGVCCRFLKELNRHAGRWRHVVLQVCCERTWNIQSLDTLSSLKTLNLDWSDPPSSGDAYLTLFNRKRSPNLVGLSIHSPGIRGWHIISLPPSFSKLEFRGTFRRSPGLALWMILLGACPNLTVLRLCDITLPLQQTDDDSQNRPSSALAIVELALLQKLELFNIAACLARGLLEHLRLPAECSVSVRCNIHDSSPSASFLSPALSHHGIFHCGGNTDQATIIITEHPLGFRLVVVLPLWCISLRLNGAEAVRDALEWFGISTEDGNASSQSGNSQPVTLRLGRYARNVDLDLLETISGFQCITDIEIDGLCPSAQVAFFRYLSGPGDPGRPTTSAVDRAPKDAEAEPQATVVWPFPSLCEMFLEGLNADAVNALVNAIQSRSGDGGAPTGWPGIPARLKRIVVVDGEGKELECKGMFLFEENSDEAERFTMDILDILNLGATEPSTP